MTELLSILDTIDSTSSEVVRRLEKGYKPPFAVAAFSQTQGRGRRGRTWVGEEGNFFLSLAVASPSLDRLSTMSLEVAVIVADWIWERFKFKPTLKWPNDLLHQGKKLGGILCETSISGDEVQYVVVGVGLNLVPVSNIEGRDVVSISEISNLSFDLTTLYRDLSDRIVKCLFTSKNVLGDFSKYGTEGSLWGKNGKLFKERQITSEGSLVLESLESHETERLSSSHHDFKWWLQDHNGESLWIGDLGNSRLKVAKVGSKIEDWHTFATAKHLAGKISIFKESSVLFLAAVGKNAVSDFRAEFLKRGILTVEVRKRSVFVDLGTYDLNQIGVDRLAFMEGFVASLSLPMRSSSVIGVLVSVGTATTMDAVRGDGVYLGGSILPGLQMGLGALASETSLLPRIRLSEQMGHLRSWRATSTTEDSMISGAQLSVLGPLHKILEDLRLEFPRADIKVVLTGGGAHFFPDYIQDDSLILKGIRVMTLG
jgi:BirA family biotin operon repressor/biotin-[acetyl-CoA-carboxylase] ligase